MKPDTHKIPSLYETCVEIYQSSRDGQQAVEAYILANHPDIPWMRCYACEADEPVEGDTCLVCGTYIDTVEW